MNARFMQTGECHRRVYITPSGAMVVENHAIGYTWTTHHLEKYRCAYFVRDLFGIVEFGRFDYTVDGANDLTKYLEEKYNGEDECIELNFVDADGAILNKIEL